MHLTSNVEAWRPRNLERGRRWGKALFLAAVLLVASQYFAGCLFLWCFRLDPRAATPLTVARYAFYYADRKDVHKRAWLSSAAGLAVVLLPCFIALWPKPRKLHGEAVFATPSEIRAAGLFADAGIVLGQLDCNTVVRALQRIGVLSPKFIVLAGQTGVAIAAEPGAGKGTGIVCPNLLSWNDSVICADPKNENYTITAGYRRSIGQAVYLFNPLSPEGRTARWNPLDYVSALPGQRVSDLQLIAHMFFPDPPGADPFWAAGGRFLFLGIALYIFETPSLPRTIGEILRQGMANDEEGFTQHWKRVVQGRMSGNFPLSDTCVRALYEVIDLAPQTASSIRKTFTSKLELWANPILDAATAASDFDLRDLRKKPMSIYLGVMPKDLDRLAPLMSLFFQQAIALQTDELPEHNPQLIYQLKIIMDEFPAYGPIPILRKSSGFLRGYNVRLAMIMQSSSQNKENYGEHGAKTLQKTLGTRIYFAPKDMDDAAELSNELGFTTVKVKSKSRPAFGLFSPPGHRHGSINESEQKRPLMLPQELRDLGEDRQIILTANVCPILCRKIRYYQLPIFRRRLLKAPIVPPIATTGPAQQPFPPEEEANAVSSASQGVPIIQTREATQADIERIDELTLDDFDTDPDAVHIPQKGENERMTEAELNQAVESFLTTLREQ